VYNLLKKEEMWFNVDSAIENEENRMRWFEE